jgi:hypothetical protein
MHKVKFVSMLVISGMLGAGLVACEKEGPAERAGKQIDAASKDLKEGAEKAADKVDEAAEKLQDKLDDK